MAGRARARATPKASSGISSRRARLLASSAGPSPRSWSGRSAAPTQSRPSGRLAAASRPSRRSLPPGRPRPERLSSAPPRQARISGFLAIGSSRPRTLTPRSALSAHTDSTFTAGTSRASISAARVSPAAPNRLPTVARPR
ncbi:hypothetical protein D3C72_1791720 [compost metagenome]